MLEPLLQGDGKGGETFASDLREHHTEQKVLTLTLTLTLPNPNPHPP